MTDPNKLKALTFTAIEDRHKGYKTEDPRNQGIFELGDWLILPPSGPGPVAIVAGEENARKIADLLSGSLIPAQPTPEQGRVEELEAEVARLKKAVAIYDKCADDCINHAMFSNKQIVVDHIKAANKRALAALNKGEG